MNTLLCVSRSFSPETTPTAIRAGKLLERLGTQREVVVLTESRGATGVRTEVVRSRRPVRLLATLRRLRMDKLIELLVWPDDSIFWVLPAILRGRRLIREISPSAIVVFMMPYSAGLAGIVLSRISGLPLILNLDDSPTCTDMHPHFPTRLHHRLARALEDLYIRRADAVIYVSARNLESVAERQDEHDAQKLHLVRYGADRPAPGPPPSGGEDIEIANVGGMSGWWSLIDTGATAGLPARAHAAWTRLGRHELLTLDQRTSSPAVIARAILDAIAERPEWTGRIRLTIHGNPYPQWLVDRALADAGIGHVVSVRAPVPHDQIDEILMTADLLFLTLPKRTDGSPGGRISAKTYEYLATDRPILAAVPQGENWDYLEGRPGVWLLEPDDHEGMKRVITELTDAKFAGAPRRFDRDYLQAELSYETRANEFAAVIDDAIARGRGVPSEQGH